jgi:hypothetical protein
MQHRIQRTRADFLAVAAQLLNDAQPEDRLLAGMVEDMPADQAAIQIQAQEDHK